MARDYAELARLLRAKANAEGVTAAERKTLIAKADEFASKVKAVGVPHMHELREIMGERMWEEFGFPDDYYETMDQWYNLDTGSGAE